MPSTAPAADTGLPAFDRRSFLATLAAAGVLTGAAVPVVAADHPDAELLQLVAELRVTTFDALDKDAEDRGVFERCEELTPPVPSVLAYRRATDFFEICHRPDQLPLVEIGGEGCHAYLREEHVPGLRRQVAAWNRNGSSSGLSNRGREIVAALDARLAAVKAAEDASGVTAFHEASRAIQERIDHLVERIAATPARTVEGVAEKAWAAADQWTNDTSWIEAEFLPDLLAGRDPYGNRSQIMMAASLIVDAMKLGAAPAAAALDDRDAA